MNFQPVGLIKLPHKLLREAEAKTRYSPSCYYQLARRRVRWSVNVAAFVVLILIAALLRRALRRRGERPPSEGKTEA